MKIIQDRNNVVYYYKDFPDLLTKEEEFKKVQVQTDHHFFGSVNPVIVCPRDGETIILLWNSGDKNKDKENLVTKLGKLGIDFNGEL